jgi:MFS family permease
MIAVPPLVPALIKRFSARKVQVSGLLLFGTCLVGFGCIEYLGSTEFIIVYGLTLRLVQGVCSALIQTSCYAVAATDFADRKDAVIGLLEATMGVGNGIGPVIGASLYVAFGFDVSFYIFGVSMLFFAALMHLSPINTT